MILVDLDHFKDVNDRASATRPVTPFFGTWRSCWATRCARSTCARGMAGKRSSILLPQTAAPGAVELAERLRQALESRPAQHAGQHDRGHGVVRRGDVSGARSEWRLAGGGGGQGAVRSKSRWKKLREGHAVKQCHSSALSSTCVNNQDAFECVDSRLGRLTLFCAKFARLSATGATGFDGVSEAVAACPGRRAPGKTLGKYSNCEQQLRPCRVTFSYARRCLGGSPPGAAF